MFSIELGLWISTNHSLIRCGTYTGLRKSPPGPPSFNIIIKLILKKTCPKDGGNYTLPFILSE